MRTLRSHLPMILLAGLILAPVSLGAEEQPPAKSPPPSVDAPVIVIDLVSGRGAGPIDITNNSDKPKEFKISLRVVTSAEAKPSNATVRLSHVNDQEKSEPRIKLPIKPGEKVRVWAMVSDVWETGDLEAELYDADVSLGSRIKIKRFPFDLKFDGTSPDSATLSLVDGTPTTITLKNNDATPYHLTWKLSINGRERCGDNLTIPALGIALLKCEPSPVCDPSVVQWRTLRCPISRFPDLFKPQSGDDSSLLLYTHPAGSDPNLASPQKKFPVTAGVSYFAPFTQQLFSNVVIIAVLFLGGLVSLGLSQALPNRLVRLNTKEQLEAINQSILDFSSNVDSKLAVMLKIERSRLYNLLGSRSTVSPDFASISKQVSEGTKMLCTRVGLVQQMDLVLGRLERALSDEVAPTRIAEISKLLRVARASLSKTQPLDEDLKTAETAIIDASAKVDALDQADTDFGRKLAKRALDLRADIDARRKGTDKRFEEIFEEINSTVPGPYDALQGVTPGAQEIAPNEYASLDMAITKMELIADYINMRIRRTGDARQRLKDHKEDLTYFLQTDSWSGLRAARLLRREMKDDVYPTRIEEFLLQKAEIDMDPGLARHQSPLDFCVTFFDGVIEKAAAREECTCRWDFDDGFKEQGWSVAHYFPAKPVSRTRALLNKTRPLLKKTSTLERSANSQGEKKSGDKKTYRVRATFHNAKGEPMKNENGDVLELERIVEVERGERKKWLGERSRTELIKLVAAMSIAIFGLIAGARDELLKLDILPGLVAVFVIGFGADTIKNLLTTKS